MVLKNDVGRSYKTIVEMLTDRNILNEDELHILNSLSDSELSVFMSKPIFNIDVSDKVRIIYYLTKFKISDLRTFVEAGDKDLYIVVTSEKLTTNNVKSINEFEKAFKNTNNKTIDIQLFELKNMLFNITKHVLVPQHTVITDDEEIQKIVEKFNLKSRHYLPILLRTDPVAKYYGIKPGNLVEIRRVSPSAGEYTAYRCCA